MPELKDRLADLILSGLVTPTKFHSVEWSLCQHHNVFTKEALEPEYEFCVYGFSPEADKNVLGTGKDFDAAMNDLRAGITKIVNEQ